ncbi:MAG: hypothetical protein BroJett029_16620 [Alphaproteobacteria bacterium]|nr:MAG: hypothetical protein BroJett029_16620 [Alphaproteobacteria bacterium]
MAATSEDVTYLLRLARDKSIDSRKQLVAIVSDLFFDKGTALTAHERALMTDILKKLINDVAVPVRKALAERLATVPSAPHDVIVALANDEIDVAKPVLMRSEALLDIDLIEIIHHRSQEHQLAIAMRRNLSEQVSDALVETGNSDVIKTLLENPDARIAEATMCYLVDQARRVDSFQEPLVRRHDLPPELARKLYFWVSAALRQHIIENFDIDLAALDEAVEAAAHDAVRGITAPPDPREPNKPAVLARRLAEARQITPRLLVQTLRQGEIALFEALLAEMSGLRLRLVRRLVFEPGGEGLAVCCRALEIDKPTFATIFLLSRRARPSERSMDPRELSRVLSFFEHVRPEAAGTVLARWRRDPDLLHAIRAVEEVHRDVAAV